MTSESQDLIRKRQEAIAYLRSKGRYILDRGTPPPGWGNSPREKLEPFGHVSRMQSDEDTYDMTGY